MMDLSKLPRGEEIYFKVSAFFGAGLLLSIVVITIGMYLIVKWLKKIFHQLGYVERSIDQIGRRD